VFESRQRQSSKRDEREKHSSSVNLTSPISHLDLTHDFRAKAGLQIHCKFPPFAANILSSATPAVAARVEVGWPSGRLWPPFFYIVLLVRFLLLALHPSLPANRFDVNLAALRVLKSSHMMVHLHFHGPQRKDSTSASSLLTHYFGDGPAFTGRMYNR
jgi:hypothetical protein